MELFLKKVLTFIRPTPNFTINCHNTKSLTLLMLLRLGLAHHREHKFKHSLLQQSDANVTHVLLFGDTSFDKNFNTLILEATIEYLVAIGRFDKPLFNNF